MNTELKAKLEKIVVLVNDAVVDPEMDLEYCIPEVETTSDTCNVSGNPYILLTYTANENQPTKKVSLGKTALQSTPEDLAKHVVICMEAFKDESDAFTMG